MKSLSPLIYAHAMKDLGVKEIPGKESHPRIAMAIKMAADWLPVSDDEVPWCGAIRGLWGLETGTGVPPEHYRAKSWLGWGEPIKLSEAMQGDTIVFKRPGGYHVALFNGVGTGVVNVLGGNQSNAVNFSNYPTSNIVGIRRRAA